MYLTKIRQSVSICTGHPLFTSAQASSMQQYCTNNDSFTCENSIYTVLQSYIPHIVGSVTNRTVLLLYKTLENSIYTIFALFELFWERHK